MAKQLITVPVGDWRPDASGLNAPYDIEAKDVLPGETGYIPAKAFSAISDALGDAAFLGGVATRKDASTTAFYFGLRGKLKRVLSSAATVTDVTRASGGDYTVGATHFTTALDFWDFCEFGDRLIAAQINNATQSISKSAGTNFAALAGSPPQARRVFTVGDFVALCCLSTSANSVRWSDSNDATNWTAGGASLAGSQEFPDYGTVYGMVGDKQGYVVQEGGFRTFQFVPGADFVFEFSKVEGTPGPVGAYAWCYAGQRVFLLSPGGFYSFGMDGLKSIGRGRVNRWVYERVSAGNARFTHAVADPTYPLVYFNLHSDSNAAETFDITLVYDYEADRWARREDTNYGIFNWLPSAKGLTFGTPLTAVTGFGVDAKLSSATGTIKFPTVEPCRRQLFPGYRALVTSVMPILADDSEAMEITVSATEDFTTRPTGGSTATAFTTTKERQCFVSGLVHSFSITDSSSTDWSNLSGLMVMAQPHGKR